MSFDYAQVREKMRKRGEIQPNIGHDHDAQAAYRTVVQEPEDYAENMAVLDAAEKRISAMVEAGEIDGFEAMRLTGVIPRLRKQVRATRKVFRVKAKKQNATKEK